MSGISYWITPIGGDEIKPGEEIVKSFVEERKIFGLGRHTPGKKAIRRGDWMCFYVTQVGVVGFARLVSSPEYRPEISPFYPVVFRLGSIHLHLGAPVPIDSKKRAELDAFKTRTEEGWGWFVTTTHRISRHDFRYLVRNPREDLKQVSIQSMSTPRVQE